MAKFKFQWKFSCCRVLQFHKYFMVKSVHSSWRVQLIFFQIHLRKMGGILRLAAILEKGRRLPLSDLHPNSTIDCSPVPFICMYSWGRYNYNHPKLHHIRVCQILLELLVCVSFILRWPQKLSLSWWKFGLFSLCVYLNVLQSCLF